MSQWARNNPDAMREIAALPPSAQQEALRDANRRLPSQERAAALRKACRQREQERQDHYDDMLRDAEEDARALHEEGEEAR